MPSFITDRLIGLILYIKYHLFAKQISTKHCLYLNYPDDAISVTSDARRGRIISRDGLPQKEEGKLRLVLVSDTHDKHSHLGTLPRCDVFIHSGDILMTSRQFTASNIARKLDSFNRWLGKIDAPIKVVLSGNHDAGLERLDGDGVRQMLSNMTHYSFNSSITIGDDISVFGSPVSEGTSRNRAFQSKLFVDQAKEDAPDSCTILLLHGPCTDVAIKHKIMIFGHHHSAYGIYLTGDSVRGSPVTGGLTICSSNMDDSYRMSQAPIVLDIPMKDTWVPAALPVQGTDIVVLGAPRKESRSVSGNRSSKVYATGESS